MRTASTLALCGLLVLGGCIGPAGQATPSATTDAPADDSTGTASPTETPTQTPSETPTPTDAPRSPTDTATPAEPTDANTVAYEDLNTAQQAAVDDALDGTVEFVPDSPYVNDSEGYSYELIDPFRDHEYVAVDGTHYDIELAGTGTLYASYGIRATEATPDENATVVAVDDLPERVRDEVRSAVENGSYHAPMGKWDSLPQALQDTRYVSHGDETYRLSYVVGDFWAFELRLDRVE